MKPNTALTAQAALAADTDTPSAPASAPRADESPAVPAADATWRQGVGEWIREHDHRWLFVITYLGLAVVLSVFVSLFWLVFMALVHLLLEVIRHLRADWPLRRVIAFSAWEVKLDFALVVLALGAVLYIDVVMGILGIQSAARAAAVTRAGARMASRVAAWERNIRAFLLTIDEMVRIGRAAAMMWRRKGGAPPVAVEPPPDAYPWQLRWSTGDRIAIGLFGVCTLLILVAPLTTDLSMPEVFSALAQELRPFPS
jgi:hypothetical protein